MHGPAFADGAVNDDAYEGEQRARAPTAAIREFLRNSISIADVITRQIWSGRLIVPAALVLGLVYGLYRAHRAGPTIRPSSRCCRPKAATAAAAASGAIGMLASLAGGGGGGPVPKFTQFRSRSASVGVAAALDQKYDMVCASIAASAISRPMSGASAPAWTPGFNAFLARVAGLPDPNGALTIDDLAQ